MNLCFSGGVRDTCDGVPKESLTSLPPTCYVRSPGGKLQNYVDVGQCPDIPCQVYPGNSSVHQCCTPSQTLMVDIQCDEFSYQLPKVTRCSCDLCPYDRPRTTGIELTLTGEGLESWQTVKALIEYQGTSFQIFDRTTFLSVNQFEPLLRVSISKVYNMGSFQFLPMVKVLPLAEGRVSSHTIYLRKKPLPSLVLMSPNIETTLHIPWNHGDVRIPKNSIINPDGTQARGPVYVYVIYQNMTDSGALLDLPGKLIFHDDEGELRYLQAPGILGIHAESNNGDVLYVMGTLRFEFRDLSDNIDGMAKGSFWELRKGTIGWNHLESERNPPLHLTLPYPVPYINCAAPLLRRELCEVRVAVYSDNNMIEGVPDVTIRVATQERHTGTYISHTSGVTDIHGFTCLVVPCGHSHELIPVSAYVQIKAINNQILPKFLKYHSENNSVTFDSRDADSITDSLGPVHFHAAYTCHKAARDSFHFRFVTQTLMTSHLQVVEPRAFQNMSWYQQPVDDASRKACVVKVFVQVSSLML